MSHQEREGERENKALYKSISLFYSTRNAQVNMYEIDRIGRYKIGPNIAYLP